MSKIRRGRMKRLTVVAGVFVVASLLVLGCGKKGEMGESHTAIEPEGGVGPKAYPVMIALPGQVKIAVRDETLVVTITPSEDIDLAGYSANVGFTGAASFWEGARPLAEESTPVKAGEAVEVTFPYDPKMDEGMLQIFLLE